MKIESKHQFIALLISDKNLSATNYDEFRKAYIGETKDLGSS